MNCAREGGAFSFQVESQSFPVVVVEVTPSDAPDQTQVVSSSQVQVSSDLLTFLQRNAPEQGPSDLAQAELASVKLHITDATRRVVGAIKYCLKQRAIGEDLIGGKGFHWSLDGGTWRAIRGKASVSVTTHGYQFLDDRSADMIQEFLEHGPEPLVALKFLHRAMTETNPRYMWLDATIAAELAIKEFLIRSKPEIETLLLELPSPPLHKLYGTVLESIAGQRSPKLSAVSKGADIRNQLIHRPQGVEIGHQQAYDYVKDVEAAIGHLVGLLYPDYYSRGFFVDS
jgi:hypothetical protein